MIKQTTSHQIGKILFTVTQLVNYYRTTNSVANIDNPLHSLFFLMLLAVILAKDTLSYRLEEDETNGSGYRLSDVTFATRTRIDGESIRLEK